MVDLNIEFDRKKYADVMRRVSLLANEAQINKAINRAAKRAADSARTESTRQIASEYTLPTPEIRKTIKTRNLSPVGAAMQITSSPFALPKFKGTLPKEVMPPKKGPVKVENKRGSSDELSDAFVSIMPNGHKGVFERSTEAQYPISQLFGPSTTGMFKANENVNESVTEKAQEIFDKRIIHELERLMYG